jgi:dephospho-CoA kinase
MTTRPSPTSPKPVIGILGGIGAGKSTIAQEFVALGCRLIDADAIGHELLRREDILRQVLARWGQAVAGPDGAVDRKALAAVVFADPAELAALNAILHPAIRREMTQQIAQAQADPAASGAVVDAAVLLEAGWDDLCTDLVFLAVSDTQRAQRVRDQRGWDRDEWQRREKSQFSLDKKAERCNYVIDNRSSGPHLREQVRQIFHRMNVRQR